MSIEASIAESPDFKVFQQRAESAQKLRHAFAFDPTYGFTLNDLLEVQAPDEPPDFQEIWTRKFTESLRQCTQPKLIDTGVVNGPWRIHDWSHVSTGGFLIRGWALLPHSGVIRRAFVVGHGYGGRTAPDLDFTFEDSVIVFPCSRGLGRSSDTQISADSRWHVLHDIHSRDNYIIGKCVEDLWTCVTAILELFPDVEGHIGYLGTSFGGGIGAMALPWDKRIQRANLIVPTFGNQPLRLRLPTTGSAASLQAFYANNPATSGVLAYYDAAVAARHIQVPILCACAAFDPVVAPPGQFAILNSIPSNKEVFVLTAGHHPCRAEIIESQELLQKIHHFFSAM
jgi:cephalosporin-C deacetylase